MRRKPSFWFLLSLLCVVGAACWWGWHNGHAGVPSPAPADAAAALKGPGFAPAFARDGSHGNGTNKTDGTNTAAAAANSRLRNRLSNTTEPLGKLIHNDKAILLANALIDTSKALDLKIPDRLRARANSGSYVVQSSAALNDQFRALLRDANATIVSYIPNNAYLVRVSDAGAQQIAASGQTQSVLPYEPYYKLDNFLLNMTMANPDALPAGGRLNLTVFADAYQQTIADLQKMGATVVSQQQSPFGPVLTVQAKMGQLDPIASLPGVEGVEAVHARQLANDLDRPRLNVSPDSTGDVTTDYLGLTGTNVVVAIDDDSVDAAHPDLTNRITSDNVGNLSDLDGHGTHVAGTILGTGAKSQTIWGTNAPYGSATNANFRGMAPNANGYVLFFESSDAYLQQAAALTNALISNNSWNYTGDYDYDVAAASYDAAVRDALPQVTGSQPVLFVFSAGNDGGGYTDGTGGSADTILSPATAKNVITVGAIETLRNIPTTLITSITNYDTNGHTVYVTNYITNSYPQAETDNPDIVADFSSRGNVGINVEGTYGRFKPDVVAPGTFVVSCRSQEWDTNSYYNPIYESFYDYTNNVIGTGSNDIDSFLFPVPLNAFKVIITLVTNSLTGATNLPPMNIYVGDNNYPTDSGTPAGTNSVILDSNSVPAINAGDTIYFDVQNTSSNQLNFDVDIVVLSTNDNGNYFEFLYVLNNPLAPYYRYESGTSMAAAGVSGTLALMQEFFQQRWHVTNSPALMKALLINGARSLSDQYDCAVNDPNLPSFQGWGLPNLMNTIPPALDGTSASSMPNLPLQFVDQNPTNAVATGQSFTWKIQLGETAQFQDLRTTLVWTDPPGNPQAGVKLVNDLDLIITNLDTGDVYYGNDIPVGSAYNQATDTNAPPNIDSVNNVENIFLPWPLSTNYSITVFGHRVNVNAVTANTNNVVQDYALVVASGDASPALPGTNYFTTFALQNPNGLAYTNFPRTNLVALSNGLPILNQRVGANSQYSGSTNGITNQWMFYVYTNTPAFSNVAFVTFEPDNLGLPRMGAFTEVAPPNITATRYAGADIDLFSSFDPNLTNLFPSVLNSPGTHRSVGPVGDEVVYYTNLQGGEVFYVGVKAEDQEAAQFSIIGFGTDTPFSQTDTNGNTTVTMNTVPLTIPGGAPTQPQSAMLVGICTANLQVRKVVVTNNVTCQDFGDYIGALSEGSKSAVLNNHSFFTNVNDTTETLIYDDTGESDPGSIHSAGPGSLLNFAGVNAMGTAWMYKIVNDSSLTDTGQINYMSLYLEKQPPPNSGYYHIDALPVNSWYYGFVDVPANATNLVISVSGVQGPMQMYVQEGTYPTPSYYLALTNLTAAGGSISINKFDTPPLNAGRYFFALYTENTAEPNLSLNIQLQYTLTPEATSLLYVNGYQPLLDDAVTYSTNPVSASGQIVSVEAGVRIIHPRESDLALTLISPHGTRVLLSENRGAMDTNGYGAGTNIITVVTNGIDGAAYNTSTTNISVGANAGVINVSYTMYGIPDEMAIYYDGSLIYDTGFVNNTNANFFSVAFGPGVSTNITITMNPHGNTNQQDQAWNYTATIIGQTASYAVFTQDTNKTQLPIKFAVPPFGTNLPFLQPQTNAWSGFEALAPGIYYPTIPFTFGGSNWTVSLPSNAVPPTVVNVPALAQLGGDGSNVLALHDGAITTTLPTIAGFKYQLSFAYHGRPDILPVSWWKAENNTVDSSDGSSLYNISTNLLYYTNGVVGQAFEMSGGVKLRAPDSRKLQLTNAFTVEAWVSPSNVVNGPEEIILQRGSSSGPSPYTLMVSNGLFIWEVMDISNKVASVAAPYFTNQFLTNGFVHVAGTYWWPPTNAMMTNVTNAIMTLYVNGLPLAFTNTPVIPPSVVDTGLEVGLGVGCSGGVATNDPFGFMGLLDEVTLYKTNLTDAQVQDIFAAETAGKDPYKLTPTVTADVMFGGITNQIAGLDYWDTEVIEFTATTNNMTLTIAPNEDGMLIDAVQLVQVSQPNPANYYLPEESLAKLAGEDPNGNWQLEVVDNRAGATNPTPTLVSWYLNLGLTDTTPYAAPLVDGVSQTNTINPGDWAYYQVNVPLWASYATNILLSATAPVNLWFDQTVEPTSTNAGDSELLFNQTSGFATLVTNGVNFNPPLLPGFSYFLGVQNTSGAPVTFAVQVDFDIPVLTNQIPETNIVRLGIPQYYQFNVDTNAIAALFQVLNPSGSVQLVVSHGAPLPDTNNFAYISALPGTSAQNIIVVTNEVPVPLGPGTWYVGVFNTSTNDVMYVVKATEILPPQPQIIQLTNNVPVAFTAPPGPALSNFYEFTISGTTNNGTNVDAVLFELYGLNGNVDLTLDLNAIPWLPPFFASSQSPGTNREMIVLRTNLMGTNLIGNWYLGIPNNTSRNISGYIRAVVATNGILMSGAPGQMAKGYLPPSGANYGLTLVWPGVPGDFYQIDFSTNLFIPTSNWTVLGTVLGDGSTVSFTDTNAIPIPGGIGYYQILILPNP